MDISIVEQNKEGTKTTFLLKKANTTFANTLRRVIMAEVPVMAIEKVTFSANTSILYDEVLAHRLGLIPLKTDLKSYTLPEECSCKGEGCARCQLKLSLKVKGPGTVYASDIQSTDPKVVPLHPKMIITKLKKGQELALEATATLGIGKTHMKWSPGNVYYKFRPEIEIDDKKINNPEEVVKNCPDGILELKGNKVSVNKDKLLTTNVDVCQDLSEGITVKDNDSEILFTIESWGQLKCKEIIKKAAEVMHKKEEEFIGLL